VKRVARTKIVINSMKFLARKAKSGGGDHVDNLGIDVTIL
jgi:hypothetical protein